MKFHKTGYEMSLRQITALCGSFVKVKSMREKDKTVEMEAREDANRHLALKQSTRKAFFKQMEKDMKLYQDEEMAELEKLYPLSFGPNDNETSDNVPTSQIVKVKKLCREPKNVSEESCFLFSEIDTEKVVYKRSHCKDNHSQSKKEEQKTKESQNKKGRKSENTSELRVKESQMKKGRKSDNSSELRVKEKVKSSTSLNMKNRDNIEHLRINDDNAQCQGKYEGNSEMTGSESRNGSINNEEKKVEESGSYEKTEESGTFIENNKRKLSDEEDMDEQFEALVTMGKDAGGLKQHDKMRRKTHKHLSIEECESLYPWFKDAYKNKSKVSHLSTSVEYVNKKDMGKYLNQNRKKMLVDKVEYSDDFYQQYDEDVKEYTKDGKKIFYCGRKCCDQWSGHYSVDRKRDVIRHMMAKEGYFHYRCSFCAYRSNNTNRIYSHYGSTHGFPKDWQKKAHGHDIYSSDSDCGSVGSDLDFLDN